MEINIRDSNRIVEIWLTNQDQKDESIGKFIQSTAEEYSGKKYKVVVFRSGSRDLYDCTEGLIKHNRRLNLS